MKKYIYCPIYSDGYDINIQFNCLEDIIDFSVDYAVLDALSLEYYFKIEIH